MRFALAWLAGTAVFALGMVLADRAFWTQCNGLPTSRYGEVWICSNALALRIAVACLAGVAAGLATRGRALVLGALVGLAGVAVVSLAYRPMLAFTQPAALLNGALYFILPVVLACLAAAALAARR
jgi:hypothetical protein